MHRKLKSGLKKAKWSIWETLFKTKLKQLKIAGSEARRIIVYHGVTKNARTDINTRFVSTEAFEKHLKHLAFANQADPLQSPHSRNCAMLFALTQQKALMH